MAQKILSPTSTSCKTPTTPTCSLMLPPRTNAVLLPLNDPEAEAASDASARLRHPLFVCGICLKYFQSTPKLLSCLHTFCERCLKSHMPTNSLSISCPTCKAQVILPENGIQALQTNHFIQALQKTLLGSDLAKNEPESEIEPYCKQCTKKQLGLWICTECNTKLCNDCKAFHESVEEENQETGEAKNHNVKPCTEISPETNLICPNHENRPLELFCLTCETGICYVCQERDHCHHKIIPMTDAVNKQKEKLKKLISSLQNRHIPAVRSKLEDSSSEANTLLNNLKTTEDKIVHTFEDAIITSNERKNKLSQDALDSHPKKASILDDQKKNIEAKLLRILTCHEAATVINTEESSHELMIMCKELGALMSDLDEIKEGMIPSGAERDCLRFDEGDYLKKINNKLIYGESGERILTREADGEPDVCAAGDGLRRCVVGDETTVKLIANKKSKEDQSKDIILEGFLKHISASGSTRVIQQCKISKTSNDIFELLYTAKEAGYHMLSIKLNGHQIQDSPFKVRAHRAPLPPATPSPLRQRRRKGSAPSPRSIPSPRSASARRHQRHSAGSDFAGIPGSSASQINIGEEEDDLLFKIGNKGRHGCEFTNPQGLCALENGGIAIADSNNSSIQIFDSDGKLQTMFGIRGRKPGNLQRPTGVATSPYDRSIFVTDYENRWVSVHAPQEKGGRFRTRLGVGRLLGPKGVAVDAAGQRVVVVDNKASKVQIFNAANGRLIHKFGSRGNGPYQFAGPHYVALNSDNEIIVSDFHNHCVKVYSEDGEFKFSFGSEDSHKEESKNPHSIVISDNTGSASQSPEITRGRSAHSGTSQRYPSAGSISGRTRADTFCSPSSSPAKRRSHWTHQTFHSTSLGESYTEDGSGKPPRPRSSLATATMTSSWPSPSLSTRSQQRASPRTGASSAMSGSFWSSRPSTEAAPSMTSLGSKPSKVRPGFLEYPTGVAVDDQDRIIVADWLTDSVQIFSKTGNYLARLRTFSDPLYGPQGIAVTSDGHIVVSDSGNHCYKVYKYVHHLEVEEGASVEKAEKQSQELDADVDKTDDKDGKTNLLKTEE